MSNFAMRHAVKAYEADCRMYREKAFDEINRACNLLTRGDYCAAADALYEAVTDVHKAFLMGGGRADLREVRRVARRGR